MNEFKTVLCLSVDIGNRKLITKPHLSRSKVLRITKSETRNSGNEEKTIFFFNFLVC